MGTPTNAEELRQRTLDHIDVALSHPLLVQGDNRLDLEAQRRYWLHADAAALQALLACY